MVTQQDTQNLLLNGSGQFAGDGGDEQADGAAKPKGGLDFGPYIRTLKRNVLLIVGITAVATAPAILSSIKAAKTYQGSFRILVEPVTSQGRETDPSAISRAQSGDVTSVDYATLLQVLQSPDILDKVAKQIQSRYPDVTADSLMGEIFSKNLVVQRVGGTDYFNAAKLIDVSYKGRDPQKTQFILEELSKAYLKYSLDDRRIRIGGGVDFIEDQLPALQQRVNTLETQLQQLRERYRLTDPSQDAAGAASQFKEIQTQRTQTQRELAEQQTLYNRLKQQLGLTPDEAMIAASLSENSRYQELIAEIKKIETQIAIKAARFSRESPVLQSLLEQERNLQNLLQEETQKNLGQRFAVAASNSQVLTFQNPLRLELIRQLVTTSNNTQVLQIRAQAVAQTEAFLDQRLQQFPAIVRQYNDLQQQLDIANKTLTQFLTQRETLRIEAAQKEVPWEVIAAPKLAMDASGKPVPAPSDAGKKLMTQVAIGVFLGIAAAFLRERLTNVFYSSEDIQSAAKASLLGVIPYNRGLNEDAATSVDNDSILAKAFGSLYTNLRFLTPKPIRSLVVGSASAGEGKTTIALNLAITAATMGQRVLLVDANFRSPQLQPLLNLPNTRGVSDVLMEEGLDWRSLIQRSSHNRNLSVLVAGQATPEASKLLASAKMQNLMHQLQGAFDFVVYDTPNLTDFLDTSFLIAPTSGILLVASLGKVRCPAVKNVLKELEKFRLPLLGVVSNQVADKRSSKSRSQSRPYEHLYSQQPSLLENLKVLDATSSSASSVESKS